MGLSTGETIGSREVSLGCQGGLVFPGAIPYQSVAFVLDMLMPDSVRWAGTWILDIEP